MSVNLDRLAVSERELLLTVAMNYRKLVVNLRFYGRCRNWHLVNSIFHGELRHDPKYKQWVRLVSRAEVLALSNSERAFLMDVMGVSTAVKANRILSGR